MSELLPQIKELLSTPTREEMFKLISSLEDGFTFTDAQNALKKEQIIVSTTLLQTFIKSLSHRGYLKEYKVKETEGRGRTTIHYRKA